MKGKTNQPLRIEVWVGWADHPAMKELAAYGHEVRLYGHSAEYGRDPDLILHPAAHGWSEEFFATFEKKDGTVHRPYTEAAIKAARARKRRTT